MEKVKVGRVKHFYRKINIAVIELTGELKVGDTIEVGRNEEDAFQQVVTSMQIDKKSVENAKECVIGMKMDYPVKKRSILNKIIEC